MAPSSSRPSRASSSDPYSLDYIQSAPTLSGRQRLDAMKKATTARAPTSSSPMAAASPSRIPMPATTGKRNRATSEDADYARKRHILSSPSVRAQSVTVGSQLSNISNGHSTPANPMPSRLRDSGFNDENDVPDAELHNKPSTVPVDRDSGFHGAVSEASSAMDDSSPAPRLHTSAVVPDGSQSPANSPATQTDDEFHDAITNPDEAIIPPPVHDADATIHASAERTITVSSRRRASLIQESIEVSRDEVVQEQSVVPQSTPSKRAHGKAIAARQDENTAPTRNSQRNKRPAARMEKDDTPNASIQVSGGDYEGEQVIHAKSRTAAESQDIADSEEEDDDMYTVSHISKHRIVDGEVQLLVHWLGSPDDNVPTWEQEEDLQETAIDAVEAYWNTFKDGRRSVRPFEVYKIIGHEWSKTARKTLYLKIAWQGYKDTSLEPVSRFQKDQPQLVKDYFESIGGRPKAPR